GMWRNVANYLPAQGFDEILDENAILKAFPEAEAFRGEWGLSDEYAFKLAEKELKEATQPLMIYILTITNHTPYEVPKNYELKPLKVSERLLKRMQKGEEEAMRLLETYQYANNALGEFVADIKQSSLGDSTLVAATGDHRLRGFTMSYPNDLPIIHAVPFYLYIPTKIQQQVSHKFDSKRVGSHKDIFPTLYAFSLSKANYYSLGGGNILNTTESTRFGYNPEMTVVEQGMYLNSQPEKLYKWVSESTVNLKSTSNETPNVGNDYHTLQTLYINSQVKGVH
ncbi:LTA synthase family protein, partial [Aliivibrio sp. S3MY1]|uniref:LTA synthase family protein n=1 Tax=unclassified Aliivibrio TaxID=2645654 RepID=UPI002379A90B